MFPIEASTFAGGVDAAFWLIFAVCLVLLLSVTGLMVFFVWRYHRTKRGTPTNIEGSPLLELFWTAALTVVVLVMFYFGWIGYREMVAAPAGALEVKAEGRMWMWIFEYENGKKTDVLHLPLGKPVKLALSSVDVLHSLFVPAFRMKKDLVPGIENTVWFTPDEVGSYDLFCTEYCGFGHAAMLAKVVVVPESEFAAWLEGKAADARPAQGPAGPTVVRVKGR